MHKIWEILKLAISGWQYFYFDQYFCGKFLLSPLITLICWRVTKPSNVRLKAKSSLVFLCVTFGCTYFSLQVAEYSIDLISDDHAENIISSLVKSLLTCFSVLSSRKKCHNEKRKWDFHDHRTNIFQSNQVWIIAYAQHRNFYFPFMQHPVCVQLLWPIRLTNEITVITLFWHLSVNHIAVILFEPKLL